MDNITPLIQAIAVNKAVIDESVNSLIDKSFLATTENGTLKDDVEDTRATLDNIATVMTNMQQSVDAIYNIIWSQLQPPLQTKLQSLEHRFLLEETDTPEEVVDIIEASIRGKTNEDERTPLIAVLLYFLENVESTYAIETKVEESIIEVPYGEEVKLDEDLDAGLIEVEVEGVLGHDKESSEVTYYKDLVLVRKRLGRERISAPVTRVVRVGIRSTSPVEPEVPLEPEIPENPETPPVEPEVPENPPVDPVLPEDDEVGGE